MQNSFLGADRASTVLVTGGAGFLGSHVCDLLVAEGKYVLCVDNLLTGRRENIQHLIGNAKFQFHEGDVRDALPEVAVSEIWNLASPASPPQYQADPIGTMMVNVVGTARMLELARKNKARFFQASTSEVYGDPEVHPQVESYRGSVNTIGPRACYDEGKRAAETLCFDYARMHDVEIKVVRIFNTYGPRMDPKDGRVVSNFIVKALAGEPIELYGDGSQTRSFCYRDDLVAGFFKLMRSPKEITGPINIGNPGEYTVRQLAEIVIEMTGSSSAIVHRPLPTDDPRQRRPDITLARDKLGWEPKVHLRDGLSKTIAHFAEVAEKARR